MKSQNANKIPTETRWTALAKYLIETERNLRTIWSGRSDGRDGTPVKTRAPVWKGCCVDLCTASNGHLVAKTTIDTTSTPRIGQTRRSTTQQTSETARQSATPQTELHADESARQLIRTNACAPALPLLHCCTTHDASTALARQPKLELAAVKGELTICQREAIASSDSLVHILRDPRCWPRACLPTRASEKK